ncbi:MAG TPA: allantoinase AllB [Candidatus Acidoferrales bacterium]|jgi:allantoinase|nr:allantoinase AllB [Candidatus Acidoferrales bacterium]
MTTTRAIRSKRVVTPEGVRPATVLLRGGLIEAISGYTDSSAGKNVLDAGEFVVMPGLVDTHVHINEPGRTDWEGFESATRAAAAGGVTTLIDMPLNSIPATTTLAALRTKRKAARNKCWVNVGFWGGVVPGNTADLSALHRAGAFGFKCFLVPSGVPEFANVNETDLRAALPVLAELNAPLLVHAELPGPIDKAGEKLANSDPAKYENWLLSRPAVAETKAIEMIIRLARECRARVHIVHVSSELSLPLIRRAKTQGVRITAETCPHYLFFDSWSIGNGRTEYKCAPPIRDAKNNKKLLLALSHGEINFVVSDHSPSPPAMKCLDSGNFFKAWGGIASLQLGLPAMWTTMRAQKYSLEHLAHWMCAAPAQLAGLDKSKGSLAKGYDADIVIWNPDKSFTVQPKMLQHRHKLTPYLKHQLHGVVETTFLRGEMIYDRGRFLGKPKGDLLRRGGR